MSSQKALEEAREHGYLAGSRMAWRRQLQEAIGELRGHGEPAEALKAEVLFMQLEEARAALRRVCQEHGDNDWPNDLNLADVIEKHLAPYLDAEEDEPT